MLGLQGNSSTPKDYRCVACSATFTGLASLLVHQASHANEVQHNNPDKIPSLTPKPPDSAQIVKKDSSDQKHGTAGVPASNASSNYICECGCEFTDFNLMQEHKRTHVSERPPPLSQDITPALRDEEKRNLGGDSLAPSRNQSIPSLHQPSNPVLASPDASKSTSPWLNNTFSVAVGGPKQEHTIPTIPPESRPLSPPARDQASPVTAMLDALDESSCDDVTMSEDEPEEEPEEVMLDGPEEVMSDGPEEVMSDGPDECSPAAAMSDVMDQCSSEAAMSDVFVPEDSSSQGTHAGSPGGITPPVPGKSDNLPKNKTIMKMLATAYMKRYQPPDAPLRTKPASPKREIVPVEIKASEADVSPDPTSPSVGQLRRLLTNSVPKTRDHPVSPSDIVPVTKSFCPVVVLETRQKLIDSSNSSIQGSYQCGSCRRVFRDSDSLTVHHSTHREEKVKRCRLCKQLIISKPSLPDVHICSQSSDKASLHSVRNRFAFTRKTSFHHQRAHLSKLPLQRACNARRLFFCPLCKHSYTRRYNLTKHKCHPHPDDASSTLHIGANANTSQISKSISVGTDALLRLKEEAITTDISAGGHLPWSGTPKSFSPFYPRPSKPVTLRKTKMEDGDAGLYKIVQGVVGSGGMDTAGGSQPGEMDGGWTVPLDDETDILNDADSGDMEPLDYETEMPIDAGDADASNVVQQKPLSLQNSKSVLNFPPMPFFVKDGVKRYPCHKCHKTYSRGSTLRRHLMLCGRVRSHIPQAAFGMVHQKVVHQKVKQMHDCFVCGKTFNRRDNMMVHRRKCQLARTVGARTVGERLNVQQQSFSASKSLSLLGAKSGASDQKKRDNGANWGAGFMSLPTVLPRRVTCECGSGFTSPQLLLEHLQKHAQESYTCPTCGETLSSWTVYEAHLQIHMQPRHQLYRGPQRSQPLLLRFQQKSQPQSLSMQQPGLKKPSQSVQRPLPNQPPPPKLKQRQQTWRPKQRSVCVRCNNTFCSRSALLKHLSLNRCKGGQVVSGQVVSGQVVNFDRTNNCSHCNSDFPNALSLKFHQRSGACKPAFKPMRCPVCVRWFGTVEGLQKHLLTHEQPQTFPCHICQRVYPSIKSLKDHRRKVHRIKARATTEITQNSIQSV